MSDNIFHHLYSCRTIRICNKNRTAFLPILPFYRGLIYWPLLYRLPNYWPLFHWPLIYSWVNTKFNLWFKIWVFQLHRKRSHVLQLNFKHKFVEKGSHLVTNLEKTVDWISPYISNVYSNSNNAYSVNAIIIHSTLTFTWMPIKVLAANSMLVSIKRGIFPIKQKFDTTAAFFI